MARGSRRSRRKAAAQGCGARLRRGRKGRLRRPRAADQRSEEEGRGRLRRPRAAAQGCGEEGAAADWRFLS